MGRARVDVGDGTQEDDRAPVPTAIRSAAWIARSPIGEPSSGRSMVRGGCSCIDTPFDDPLSGAWIAVDVADRQSSVSRENGRARVSLRTEAYAVQPMSAAVLAV
jgi:hypothetical protein